MSWFVFARRSFRDLVGLKLFKVAAVAITLAVPAPLGYSFFGYRVSVFFAPARCASVTRTVTGQ